MEEEKELVETEHEQQKLEEDIISEIPVVRSNTPRPFSFDTFVAQYVQSGQQEQQGQQHVIAQTTEAMLSAFPQEAPSAPPVPEEVDEQGGVANTDHLIHSVHTKHVDVMGEATPLPLSPSLTIADATAQEFVWLFEYGLEMDNAILNSPDRLHNLALLYGPAVLKEYQLTFTVLESQPQKVVATVVPLPVPGAEVWGIVYRIPSRLIEQDDNEPSQLDLVHAAVPPNNVFERVDVVVSEAYRGRELPCITYIARHISHAQDTQHQQTAQVPDSAYLQRLLEVARKQKLPADYVQALALSTGTGASANGTQSVTPEQNTEPLPILVDRQDTLPSTVSTEHPPLSSSLPAAPHPPHLPHTPLPLPQNVGLLWFACYLAILLLAALAVAIMQGLGIAGDIFTTSFAPLNVPWYVLLYGLIGGSISCLVTLGRWSGRTMANLPDFVIIVWYTRPFVGIVLAMLAYLLLNTGLFIPFGNGEQHVMLSSLLAALIGFCENWLFKKRISAHSYPEK